MNTLYEKEIQEWIYKNLVDKHKGAEITGQSVKGFELDLQKYVYIKYLI